MGESQVCIEPVLVWPNPVCEVLYTPTGVPILSAALPNSEEADALPLGVYFLSIFFDGTTHLHRLLEGAAPA